MVEPTPPARRPAGPGPDTARPSRRVPGRLHRRRSAPGVPASAADERPAPDPLRALAGLTAAVIGEAGTSVLQCSAPLGPDAAALSSVDTVRRDPPSWVSHV
ncbi:hypothetical protein JCM9534A_12290 [Catenuloplanes indicus JCM 9534]